MSGGERQMLAVGRALMAKPKLLMLDEPSLGLAPLIVREIFRIISELRRRGVSILLVEQNARAALQVADYAYVLETGQIAMQGPAHELADDPRVIEAYLGRLDRFAKKPPSGGFFISAGCGGWSGERYTEKKWPACGRGVARRAGCCGYRSAFRGRARCGNWFPVY
jgi:ABC-type sulfate/molybdate transport systems ATPase subunit